jgi:hypothetical protein
MGHRGAAVGSPQNASAVASAENAVQVLAMLGPCWSLAVAIVRLGSPTERSSC